MSQNDSEIGFWTPCRSHAGKKIPLWGILHLFLQFPFIVYSDRFHIDAWSQEITYEFLAQAESSLVEDNTLDPSKSADQLDAFKMAASWRRKWIPGRDAVYRIFKTWDPNSPAHWVTTPVRLTPHWDSSPHPHYPIPIFSWCFHSVWSIMTLALEKKSKFWEFKMHLHWIKINKGEKISRPTPDEGGRLRLSHRVGEWE